MRKLRVLSELWNAVTMNPFCPLCHKEQPFLEARIGAKYYWRCQDCRMIFLSPEQRLGEKEERERYLEHENNPSDPQYRQFLSQLSLHLTPHLPLGAHGMDYGAGPGPTLSVMLEEQGFRMSIYDPFFAPDTLVLERIYDFITCTEAVEHFYDPAREFTRMDDLLKPGGWLGIMTEMVTPDNDFKSWWYHRDPTHVCFYRQETMAWMAGKFSWALMLTHKNVTLFRKSRCQT